MIKIIISPAKKMNFVDEYTCTLTEPVFSADAQYLHTCLSELTREKLKALWQCSDKLADLNYERLHTTRSGHGASPALLAYEGIQYQYMASHVLSDNQWDYLSRHLNILSGFYGVLKPTDSVIPYRLEMQAKLKTKTADTLYEYWGNRLFTELIASKSGAKETIQIVNLASAEYSKAILPFVQPPVTCITCIFGELINGKVKVKGTQAKMARGEMVRWMAENQITKPEYLRHFNSLNYHYTPDLSSETEYLFLSN